MTQVLKILVVDDEPGMRLGIARALRGYSVRVPDVAEDVCFALDQAATGEEALEKIEGASPDIVLLDYKLPGLTGLDVLGRLSDRRDEILTVMITAYASLETAVTATKQGAYDFLAKPFTPEELKSTVRKAAAHVVVSRQARRLAEEKRQVRFQFVSVLAHELKAPLSAIQGYLGLMADRRLGKQLDCYERIVQRCLARGEQMQKLIADLLDLTRIESGQKVRQLREVDLAALARTAIESAMLEAGCRGISIVLRGEPSVPMTADEGELLIILNNLISNAVKYNRDGGWVEVTLSGDEDWVDIKVADSGIGLTKEEAAQLFNDFVRIRNEKTRDILGSGLGLSTVKKLALLYGGSVAVESTPDVGSTFIVRLERRSTENPKPIIAESSVRSA